MAELNLDISQELNITARRGDSISFDLTFNGDSGPLNFTSDGSEGSPTYAFKMQVRTSADDDGEDTPVLATQENDVEPLRQTGAPTTTGATGLITVDIATGGAQGKVNFSIDSSAMKTVFSGVYVYDIEYCKTTANVLEKQTWVRGSFTVNEDVTIS